MAEYIERDKIGLTDFEIVMCNGDYKEGLKMLLDKIESIPAADVQPVVLCRDCDMYECLVYDGGRKRVCQLFKRQMQEADFCSYGVKRED